MKNKLKYIPLVMVLFVSALFFVPMEEVHAGRNYTLPYNEPMTDERSGYVVIEYYSQSIGYYTNTYFWSADLNGKDVDGSLGVSLVIDARSLGLHMTTSSLVGDVGLSGFFARYDSAGGFYVDDNFLSASTYHSYTSSPSLSDASITGFYFKGNVTGVSSTIDNSEPVVSFANNGATELNINEIILQLVKLNEDTDELISQIVKIYNDTSSMKITLTNINSILSHYIKQIHNVDNARIIELLEAIEDYLRYCDNDSGQKVEDFGNIIVDKNNSKEESDNEVNSSIPMDENGVGADDFGQHGRDMLSIVDSITGEAMDVYYEILNFVTDYPIVTNMILIVFVFAFCGFIFFGRR